MFLLGFDIVSAAYVGIALAFSSTIIIMKLLSDQKQLDSLYGKLAIGILIIQDLAAMAVLMFVSSMRNGTNLISFATQGLLFGLGVVWFLFPTLDNALSTASKLPILLHKREV